MTAENEKPPPSLTESQKRSAQGVLTRFFWINGIVIPCVLENILLLWALQNGLSAAHVAVLASFMLLTMPMMFLGKRLSASMGPARAWSRVWFVRYLFVLAMLPAPWLRQTGSAPWVPWLITACFFGLFSMRSMGMVNNVPIIGEVTSKEDQGSFQAGISLRTNTAYFLTLAVIIGVLRWRETPAVYQVILLSGSILGMYSARILRRLPPMEALRGSARTSLGEVARHIVKSKKLAPLALSWCASLTATALIVPIAMLAVKRGYDVADDTALLFTLLELAGAILASYTLTIIADHTGPRPIVILSMTLFWLAAGFWAFAPQKFIPAAVGSAFLLGGMARHGAVVALNHYMLASTSTRERIGVSLSMQMLSGAVSGLFGMVVAGGSIHLLSKWPPAGEGIGLYQAYYRIVLILLVPLSLAVWRLPKLRDWTVRNVIGLVFSIRDLRALRTLNALRNATSDEEGADLIEHLTQLASRHSEPVLRDFLLHGRLVQQARAIRALGRIHFGEATAEALIRVLATGEFTNGWHAAELLGQRRIAAAIPEIRAALHSDDPFLRGKCMVALARMKDETSYPILRETFSQTDNPRIAIHGARSLEYLREPEDLERILRKIVERPWPESVLHEMLLAAAGIMKQKSQAHRLLKTFKPGDAPDPPAFETAQGPPSPHQQVVCDFLRSHPWSDLPPSLRCLLSRFPRPAT